MNKYKNLKVHVSCLPASEKDIKKLFFQILEDYVTRFSLTVTDKPTVINICLVEYNEHDSNQGVTMYSEPDGRMLIQVRDPFLNDWEDNPYMMAKFSDIICHEFVHAAQYLTDRMGIKIKGLKYDKKDSQESYFFDPTEMEARLFEAPYSTLYAQHLL